MAPINPNSSLVFDFPDPSPRFEFGGDSGAGGSSTIKNKKGSNKRLGKLGKITKNGNGNNKVTTASKLGSGAATTASLDSTNFGENFFATTTSAASLKSRNHSGDIAAGPSQQATSAFPHFDMAPSPPQYSSPKPPLNKNSSSGSALNNSHTRDASAASSISEFSFDRVTVTTNDTGATGQSSVSWNFLDDGVADAVGAMGGGQDGKNGGGNKRGMFVPYTGDVDVFRKNVAKANSAVSSSSGKDTFVNVSLSDDEDDILLAGIVNCDVADDDDDGERSVVSEISDRAEGILGSIGGGVNSDAVKALLREGMKSAQDKERASASRESSKKQTNVMVVDTSKPSLAMTMQGGGDSSPSRNTCSTAGSTTSPKAAAAKSTNVGRFLEDVRTTYARFKASRGSGVEDGGRRGKRTALQSVMEDVHFCGLYCCGIDTTAADGNANEKTPGEKCNGTPRRGRDERRREAEDTFLGKLIQCGGCVAL